MCGIYGLLSLSDAQVSAGDVRRMGRYLEHRGPDDSGLHVRGRVGLGHRRLSVIDLSPRGRNPMSNEDGTLKLVFNGEIYNHGELRQSLIRAGHRFATASDAEVVLHLYEERGDECVAALNGMFAFALWDERQRRLLLARDRFGVKPLYYTRLGDTLAFASETKAFLALDAFTARPDPVGLSQHFTFQNTLAGRTLFEGVRVLEAAHYLVCEDGRFATHRYWDLRFEPRDDLTLDEWASRLRERFEAAVARQLRSDVPLGAFLSGGMDTGSIVAVAARHLPGMHTFTCGFRLPPNASALERHFDERAEARVMAERLGTRHHELELDSDAMARALPHVVWHLDEPRVGISYPVLHTAALISRHVKVVLSGNGGDELFAGYPWRYERVAGLQAGAFDAEYYRASTRFMNDAQKHRFFSERVNAALADHSTFDDFRDVLRQTDTADALHRALYFDFKTFLHGLLMVDDKLNMASSVEGRMPFLDNDLVELAATMPSGIKLRAGQGKVVLRHAMRGLLPEDALARRKQGFTPPDETWYRRELAGWVREVVLGPRALDRGYFRPEALRRSVDDHLEGRANNRFLLWSLMCFEWWNRLFVDGERLPAWSDRTREARRNGREEAAAES